jgi:hypothetical protein
VKPPIGGGVERGGSLICPGCVRRLAFAHRAEERRVTELADLLFRSKRDFGQLSDGLAVIWVSEQVGDKDLFMPHLGNSPTREP